MIDAKNTKPQIFCRNYCLIRFSPVSYCDPKKRRKKGRQKDFLQNFKITALWMLCKLYNKKFPVCLAALIYIYILHKYCLILCRIQTDRDRERPADRRLTWVVNKFCILRRRKKIGQWKNRMKEERTHVFRQASKEKKRKNGKFLTSNYYYYLPENSHVRNLTGSGKCPSFSRSFFWAQSTCFCKTPSPLRQN